jgi:hypothetical protein
MDVIKQAIFFTMLIGHNTAQIALMVLQTPPCSHDYHTRLHEPGTRGFEPKTAKIVARVAFPKTKNAAP